MHGRARHRMCIGAFPSCIDAASLRDDDGNVDDHDSH
jgi:hypothetical protein